MLPEIPLKKNVSLYESVEELIKDCRHFMNVKETQTRAYTDTDNASFDRRRTEIWSFLEDADKNNEDRARALWLLHELEARVNLHNYWWTGYYGPDGIGKTFENAKKHSRMVLIDDFAALVTIPEVARAMSQPAAFVPETQLYGLARLGYRFRRLNMTSMFVDAVVERDKDVFVSHPGVRERIKLKIFGPAIGKSFEFAPFRVYHSLDWAVSLHPPEEWYRFIEPLFDAQGNYIGYKDHTEFGYKYDQWHDPGKARWYLLNRERIGENNWQMLTEGVPSHERDEFEKKVKRAIEILNQANIQGIERLSRKDREFLESIEKIIGDNLVRLCKDKEQFLNLEEIKWAEIFGNRLYYAGNHGDLADDILTNLYVNCRYMESTQSALFDPEKGYLGHTGFETLGTLATKFEHLPSLEHRAEEVDYWFQELSDLLYANFEKATGANRGAKLGGEILLSLNLGMDRQFYRKLVFEACGIEGKDWTNIHTVRLTPSEKIRLALQHLPNPSVWEKGIFHPERGLLKKYDTISFKELVAVAGWRIRNGKIESFEDALLALKNTLGGEPTKAEEDQLKQEFAEEIKDVLSQRRGEARWEDRRKLIEDIFTYEPMLKIVDKRNLDRLIDTAVDWYLDLAIRNRKLDELKEEIGLEIRGREWRKMKMYLPGLVKRAGKLTGYLQDWPLVGEPFAGLITWATLGRIRFGKRWGPENDLWTREKLFWLIKRKTMNYAVGEGKGRPILRQLDWQKLKKQGVFAAADPFEVPPDQMGAERIANLLMGAGELIPGSIHRLSPMYLYYDRTRLLWHQLAAWSVGFWEQAAQELDLDWDKLKMWRAVMNPEKHLKIIDMIRGHGWISEKEKEGWTITLGCEEDTQVWGFTKERDEFLIPNLEREITPGSIQEGAEKLLSGLAGVAGPGAPIVSLLRTFIPIPRTPKEAVAIARTSIPLGLVALRFIPPYLAPQPFTLIMTGPAFLAGALIGAHLGKDRGDDLKGILAILFGPLSLKGSRRWIPLPKRLRRFEWGFPIWNGRDGKRQIRSITTWATPVWDDLVNPELIVNNFKETRDLLGDQTTYRPETR
jgi:hypothetical protein